MVCAMRITTWNVNGLRAAIRKGVEAHLDAIRPDVLLLQEVRARPLQLPGQWATPSGWNAIWHPAERAGYSGVAIWVRKRDRAPGRAVPEIVETGLGAADPEGRVLRARVGGIQVVSIYAPSGSSGDARQAVKDAWMRDFTEWAEPLLAEDEPVILGGDLNVAPTDDDLYNPSGNRQNSGFLPHEQAWFADLEARGWVDLFRAHHGPGKGPYSWWSNRGKARALDRGWRIDHLLGNPAAARLLTSARIDAEGGRGDGSGPNGLHAVSDHAPVSVDLKVRR
jgi:exodeoxyribonuclease-3